MPEELCNQPQNVEELIIGILADEAQIVHCLRIFFCNTLQENATEKYLCPERKVKLASDLINAAAQKEAALAAVLEAIGKFEEGPVEWITLVPGAIYQVTSSSPTITTITFEAKTDVGVTGGTISAFVDGDELWNTSGINETPTSFTANLGAPYPTSMVTLRNTGAVTVYIRNVIAGGG